MQRKNIQYINMVQIGASAYDFIIDCSCKIQDSPDDNIDTTLIMSPAHFKQMYNVMGEVLDAYESQFNNIVVPKNH